MPKTALVAGASGVAGSALLNRLSQESDCKVLALSRSVDRSFSAGRVKFVQADLRDARALTHTLQGESVTHLFYAVQNRAVVSAPPSRPMNVEAAKQHLRLAGMMLPPLLKLIPPLKKPIYRALSNAAGIYDPDRSNLAMLSNLVSALSQPQHQLQHVTVITGLKYNGLHLGPHLYPQWRLPLREDDPRAPGPSWYYDLEDYLADSHAAWTWSVVRPSFIIGYARRAPYNLGTTLAVYASVLKELDRPLVFTGGESTYNCRLEMSSAAGLADFMAYTSAEPRCANQAFNFVNGDPFRWRDIWPAFGRYFGMEVEVPKRAISSEKVLAGHEHSWNRLVGKYGLEAIPLGELLNTHFLDQSMILDWDMEVSMEKARQSGYARTESTEDMFLNFFESLRVAKIIP